MSIDINKQQVDIENLFKQNVNDLASIKDLYKKLKELEEKISQIKYIDSTLAKKLKKEYEKLKKQIIDENVQLQLNEKIEKSKTELNNKIDENKTEIDTVKNYIKFVTPEQFGAIGDGINDDTNAVIEALNYSEVKFNNTYLITQGIDINKKIHIYGDGKIKIIPKDERIEFLKLLNNSDCLIENITIETERTKTETPPEGHTRVTSLGSNVCGIFLQGTENITIRNVKFFNTEYDIFAALSMNTNITIENCYSRGSSQGIYGAQLTNSIIRSYDITNAIDLGAGDHCIYFKTDNVNNVIIENCTFVAPDENFGNLIRLSNQNGIVKNITITNCKLKGKTFFNSHSKTNKFINCEIEQIYESEKPMNGISGEFQNCNITGLNCSVLLMIYNTTGDNEVTFNNCKIANGQIQMQSGKLTITNSVINSSIYTSTDSSKEIIFMNNNFTANTSGYLIRCSATLKSIVMNNFLNCKNVYTSYLTGNIAINNAYTGNIPDAVEGGQNLLITLSEETTE